MLLYYWIIVLLCGRGVLEKHLSSEFQTCDDTKQFMKLEQSQLPMVDTETSNEQDVNITAKFQVGFVREQITGTILMNFIDSNMGKNKTCLIVKLSLDVDANEIQENTEYFFLHDIGGLEIWCAKVEIPPVTNVTLKTEVFQISMNTRECNIREMSSVELRNCSHNCYMHSVYTHNFPASRDACIHYRESSYDEIYMTLKADMITPNLTRFSGYFTNVNPYAIVHVSVFPDDDQYEPYTPLWASLIKVTPEKEVYFSTVTESLGYRDFYAKLTIACSEYEFGYVYISETATITETDAIDINTLGEYYIDDDSDDESDEYYPESISSEVYYGIVVGLLLVCCLVTVAVWLKRTQRKRLHCRNRRHDDDEGNEDSIDFHIGADNSKIPSRDYKNNQIYHPTDAVQPKDEKVMLLFHPDSDMHVTAVKKLHTCLEKFNFDVHWNPKTHFHNWRDFAEKVGEEYKTVIFVLSRGFIELCNLYRSREVYVDQKWDNRWYELIEQRHGEYIPCVVLDKLRSLIQDKCCYVRTHFVSLCDENIDTFSVCKIRDTVYDDVSSDTVYDDCTDMGFKNNHSDHVCRFEFHDPVCDHDICDIVCEHSLFQKTRNEHFMHKDINSFRCLNSQDPKELEFFKFHTFLDTKNTYFHVVSMHVLNDLLASESETDIEATTGAYSLSLVDVLQNLRKK